MMSEEYSIPGALTNEERRKIYLEGVEAYQLGKEIHESPYAKAGEHVPDDAYQRGVEWRRGWNDSALGVNTQLVVMKLIDESLVRHAVEVLNRMNHKGCTDWVLSRDHDECSTGDLFVFNPSRGNNCTYLEPFEAVAIAEKYERELPASKS